MPNSRRHFLGRSSAALMTARVACRRKTPDTAVLPAGSPPAFGGAPDVGPAVSPSTLAEAEKLVQFELSASERQTAAGNWRSSIAPLYERRVEPRKFAPIESDFHERSLFGEVPGAALADCRSDTPTWSLLQKSEYDLGMSAADSHDSSAGVSIGGPYDSGREDRRANLSQRPVG